MEPIAYDDLDPAQAERLDREWMWRWFGYTHLPPHLQHASKPFNALAQRLILFTEPGPERTVALRKLLEAKDAAVRATFNPGC